MSYSSPRYEYILDETGYLLKLEGDREIYFVDFYKNCGNFCAVCPNQKPAGANPKIYVNVASPYLLKRIEAGRSEVFFGLLSDPYQEVEAGHKLMQTALEILFEKKIPVTIMTKSALILRDIESLASFSGESELKVIVQMLSADRAVTRLCEPRCPDTASRLKVIEKLALKGVKVGLGLMPLFPELVSKTDIITRIRNSAQKGASFLVYDYIRLNEKNSDGLKKTFEGDYGPAYEKSLAVINSPGGWGKYVKETDEFLAELAGFHKLAIERFQYDVR